MKNKFIFYLTKGIRRWVFLWSAKRAFGKKVITTALTVYENVERYSVKYNRMFIKRYKTPLRGPIKARAFDRAMHRHYKTLTGCNPFWRTIAEVREIVWQYKNWYDDGRLAMQKVRIEEQGGPLPFHRYDDFKKNFTKFDKPL